MNHYLQSCLLLLFPLVSAVVKRNKYHDTIAPVGGKSGD